MDAILDSVNFNNKSARKFLYILVVWGKRMELLDWLISQPYCGSNNVQKFCILVYI